MSCIIKGYNYDIFISYRQKDNKYDGWVTGFVDNLKHELEATFKEEISIYFDINPHNGLLETHDVDASLKEKLKCLVFLPILSRTYCDPKSFAWEHEFKAFVEQASGDQFGLKVKLPGGNVANRVLPVRIHELDGNDIKLFESVLGGVLRGIEFIYKSPGVNRPLRLREDNPDENLSHTIYRDQINKVANAISEIISGLKSTDISPEEAVIERSGRESHTVTGTGDLRTHKETPAERPQRTKTIGPEKKIRFFMASSLVLIVVVAAIFLFTSGSTLPFSKRDWILITDFENLTDDPIFDYSLYTAFSLSTSQSRYINIFPRARMLETLAMMEIKDRTLIDEKTGRDMAIRQGLKIYIAPGISESGNRYAISAKIMETKTGTMLKSEILYAETKDEILPTLDKLSKKLRRILGESRYNIAVQDKPLAEATTSSLEALKLYSLGCEKHAMRDFAGAKGYYENALLIDTGFLAAKTGLGSLNIERYDRVRGRELLNQAVKSVNKLTERERLNILAIHAIHVENDMPEFIKYTTRLTELYPDDPVYHNNLGYSYEKSGKFEPALEEYKAAVKINPDLVVTYGGIIWIYLQNFVNLDSAMVWTRKLISDTPQNVWGYFYLGLTYISLDSIALAATAFEQAREVDPYFILNLYDLSHTYRLQGRFKEAIRILERIPEINRNEDAVNYNLGTVYQLMGNAQEAKKYYSRYKKIIVEEWPKKYPDDAGKYIALASVTARLGEMDTSRIMLRKAIEKDSTLHDQFSHVLCLQGRITEALDELEKAFANGYRELYWLKLHPDWQVLQYDVRFRNLLDRYFR